MLLVYIILLMNNSSVYILAPSLTLSMVSFKNREHQSACQNADTDFTCGLFYDDVVTLRISLNDTLHTDDLRHCECNPMHPSFSASLPSVCPHEIAFFNYA